MTRLQVPKNLFREVSVETGDGAVRFSISSDEPYLRYDWWNDQEYWEVLDHSSGGFVDKRLKAGLPILFNHQRDSHLARARKFSANGKRIEVSDLAWGTSELAKEKKADFEAGVLVDTSVGYHSGTIHERRASFHFCAATVVSRHL